MISKIGSPLLTGDLIKDIGDMPIEVTLIDTHTKEVVTDVSDQGSSTNVNMWKRRAATCNDDEETSSPLEKA